MPLNDTPLWQRLNGYIGSPEAGSLWGDTSRQLPMYGGAASPGAQRLRSLPMGGLQGAATPIGEAAAGMGAAGAAEGGLMSRLASSVKGGWKGGLGYTLGGQLAGGVAEQAGLPSEVSSALAGAGAGAGIGSMVPLPGATLVGAAIGGGLGLANDALGLGLEDVPIIGGLFGGGDKKPEQQTIEGEAFNGKKVRATIGKLSRQVSSATRAEINATLKAMKGLPKAQRQQMLQQMLIGLPAQVGAEAQQRHQLKQTMANQVAAGALMAQLTGNPAQLGAAQGDVLSNLAQQMPADVRPLFQYSAANARMGGQQMQNAFVGSTMAKPTLDAFQQQLSQLAQLQQQQFASQSSSGGGSQSISDLLAAGG